MKQLKFEHKFAEAIKKGEKNATFRISDDKDIKPRDVVLLVDKVDRDKPTSWEITGELLIEDRVELELEKIIDNKKFQGESFKNIDELLQTFRRFYGDHLEKNSLVSVFTFSYKPYAKAYKYMDSITSAGKIPRSVKLYADGGSRGNPGPSAWGFVILSDNNELIHSDNKYIGVTTNNQAEYHGLLSGLKWCTENNVREVSVYLDSMLVVNQLKGVFKVKNRDLWSIYEAAKIESDKFSKVIFTHVPREQNKLADREVNKALDAVKGSDIVQ